MIPIQVVRFTLDAPCVLQATPSAWRRVIERLQVAGDYAVASHLDKLVAQAGADMRTVRLTVDSGQATVILRRAGVG